MSNCKNICFFTMLFVCGLILEVWLVDVGWNAFLFLGVDGWPSSLIPFSSYLRLRFCRAGGSLSPPVKGSLSPPGSLSPLRGHFRPHWKGHLRPQHFGYKETGYEMGNQRYQETGMGRMGGWAGTITNQTRAHARHLQLWVTREGWEDGQGQ